MTRKQYDRLRREFFYRGGTLKAEVIQRIENRGGQILAPGAKVTITGKGGGLFIESETCKHCKQAGRWKGVDFRKLQLLEPIPEMPAPRPRGVRFDERKLPYS